MFIHGHVHANYGRDFKRKDMYGDTVVVNAYEYYVVQYPPDPAAKTVSSAESVAMVSRGLFETDVREAAGMIRR